MTGVVRILRNQPRHPWDRTPSEHARQRGYFFLQFTHLSYNALAHAIAPYSSRRDRRFLVTTTLGTARSYLRMAVGR